MTLPRTLLLAAAIAAPAAALADGATSLPTEAPTIEEAAPAPVIDEMVAETPVEPGLELPQLPIELPVTTIDPIESVPTIDIGEIGEHWDDCPGCGMG